MSENALSERLVFLTDGVVAIAMTLLVLDIRLPDPLIEDGIGWGDLVAIQEHLASYALSFVVVALLWLTHVQKFRGLARCTGTLFWLNILFLLGVGLVPFTTSLLSGSGNGVATAVYAGAMGFASLMLSLMGVHVRTAGLADPEGRPGRLARAHVVGFLSPAVFLLSLLVSFWSADAAKALWLLLIPIAFVRDRAIV